MSDEPPRDRPLLDAPDALLGGVLRIAEKRVSWVLEFADVKTLLELLAMAYVQGLDDASEISGKVP